MTTTLQRVIIAGGGMVGATLALVISALSSGRIQVDVVEAVSPQDQQHPGFDARAIALAYGTCQQLARAGVWQELSAYATPIQHVHVSDRGHLGLVQLNARDYGIPWLGQVVELYQAGKSLFKLLQQAPGVTLHCPARVEDVLRSTDSATVRLDNGRELHAQLLVAADGTHSALAQQCQIVWQKEDYRQIATVANVVTSLAHNGQAFERFTASGPIAMLPMSEHRSSLVWCQTPEAHKITEQLSEHDFLSALQQAFGWRLGKMEKVGARQSYPLHLTVAQCHISHRLALVGNAAQTLHPIAGQGFNLGLRDVMSLAECIAQAEQQGDDIGDYRVLAHYQQRREVDQQKTISITDGLVHLFANRLEPLILGRNLGLMALQCMPTLRARFAQRTLGWVAC